MINRKTFLMNEEDGSPGGGAVTPPPAVPAASTGAAQPATITVDALRGAVTDVFAELKNGLFAELRKSGALKTEKAPPAPSPTEAKQNEQAQPAQDVKAIIRRENAIGRGEAQHGMTPKQVEYMRVALEAANPDDERGWIDSYASDMGFAKATTQSTPTTPTTATLTTPTTPPPAAPNAPVKHDLPTHAGITDIFNLSEAQLDQLGPSGLRVEFEKIVQIAKRKNGMMPPRPKAPPR